MKIAIYSPYLDTAGGGERYMMSIAEYLSQTHEVDVLLDSHLEEIGKDNIVSKIETLHGLDLSRVNFIRAPFGDGSFFVSRIFIRLFFLKKYNFLFYLTDGSVFYSTARNNVLHIQSPLKNTNKNLWKNIKLKSWKLIMYNSKFTKEETENSWNIKGIVVYPPVSVGEIKPLKKEKIILSVGRFFGYLKDKKHKILIYSYSKLVKQSNMAGWSLHLAGSAGEGDKPYLEELKNLSKGMNIFLHPNISFEELKNLYGKASIYWHGAGYGEIESTKMEHFGISTVEAMAGGAVPVVINLGGQKEIVEDGKSGYLWNTLDEMEDLTIKIISDKKLAEKLSKEAIKRSKMYSKEKFCQKIFGLVGTKK